MAKPEDMVLQRHLNVYKTEKWSAIEMTTADDETMGMRPQNISDLFISGTWKLDVQEINRTALS